MTASTLEQRLDRLESRNAIGELLANYCTGCDEHDEDLFLSIWHEDAEYPLGPVFGTFKGHDGIREAIGIIWDALPVTRHWTTNMTIEFEDDDHARARSDVTFECVDSEGKELFGSATYQDVCERRNGIWKFSRRDVSTHYRKLHEVSDYDA